MRPFTDKQIELVTTFADQAVIAIENVRLFDEVQARTRELTEALEQQTATSEVLQVISSSPGELEPVFEAMLANATRICEASSAPVSARETASGPWRSRTRCPQATWNNCDGTVSVLSRTVSSGRVAQNGKRSMSPTLRDRAYLDGDPLPVAASNSPASAPCRGSDAQGDELVGASPSTARKCGRSPTSRSSWSQNFAAQAVIAIENTRLLNELRESLQQQTATAEVLSHHSSPGDLQPVFETMLEKATRLCEAKFGT